MTNSLFYPLLFNNNDENLYVCLNRKSATYSKILKRYYSHGLDPSIISALKYITLSETMDATASINLVKQIEPISLSIETFFEAMGGKEVEINQIGSISFFINKGAITEFLKGNSTQVLAKFTGRLIPTKILLQKIETDSIPSADEIYIHPDQIANFFASPFVPSSSGGFTRLDIRSETIMNILSFGASKLTQKDHEIIIRIAENLPDNDFNGCSQAYVEPKRQRSRICHCASLSTF